MRLESCYITGFGRLCDLKYDFKPGMNKILEENGWGKTTFSVFLKSMFYGLPYAPRRKELTEREHYEPWSGGIYGGSLTFTTDKGSYRIERTFGKKDIDDTFTLIDTRTGRESTDYSEKVGEELFGVDRESYERSIFIPQLSIQASMTDSLNAKMGNLQAARDDINQFDAALKRVEDAKKEYLRNSQINPGKLTKIRESILESKAQVEEIPLLTETYLHQRELLNKRKADLKELEKQKRELGQKIAERSRMEQALGAYHEKKAQLDRDRERLGILDDFFAQGVPLDEDQTAAEEMDQRIRADETSLQEVISKLPEESEINRLDALFHKEIPSEEDQNAWKGQADRLMELRMRSRSVQMSESDKHELMELKEYFHGGLPDAKLAQSVQSAEQKLLTLYGKTNELEESLERAKSSSEEKDHKEERIRDGRGRTLLGLVLSLLFFGASYSFVSFSKSIRAPYISLGCLLAGIVILGFTIIGAVLRRYRNRREREAEEAKLGELEERILELREEEERLKKVGDTFKEHYPGEEESVLDRLREVQRKVDRFEHLKSLEDTMLDHTSGVLDTLSDLQLTLYTALRPYAENYGADLFHEMNEQDVIARLERDSKAEREYLDRLEQIESLQKRIEENRKSLDAYLGRFPVEEGEDDDITKRLTEIRSNTKLYGQLTEEADALGKEIEAMAEEAPEEDEGTIESLQEEQASLDEKIAELNRFIPKDAEDVSQISESLVQHEEEKDRLQAMQEEERYLKERVNILNKTVEYLQKAKDKFQLRYMRPLQDGMRVYLGMLNPGEGQELSPEDFELDMDLSILFHYRGQTRSSAYLSAGYQDLAFLCARFALIDVLYRQEQPMVILDDPFTNLDPEKIKAGTDLLERLSQKKQIIYFTCHESRM